MLKARPSTQPDIEERRKQELIHKPVTPKGKCGRIDIPGRGSVD
jgi:hypothetical protein